ncbi:hypothetical protein PVK06_017248 [Gossypium arboreum]|uniref:Uncharacterized protein n=1 Tax=Gossypium arboreum TaxID=29729 RepID=A0ABR0Q303_GOSAR|nr:hypothetical protein PVK06_017248 [Gossypium arboreum]
MVPAPSTESMPPTVSLIYVSDLPLVESPTKVISPVQSVTPPNNPLLDAPSGDVEGLIPWRDILNLGHLTLTFIIPTTPRALNNDESLTNEDHPPEEETPTKPIEQTNEGED